MANSTISPNMNLTIPTVAVDPGPDWANNINASLVNIDSHNHTTGNGVPVPTAGILINMDLTFNGFNSTSVKTVRFVSQPAPLTSPNLTCVYVVNGDLYYNNAAGAQIPITSGSAVVGAPGTITGLFPPASASYFAGTFTFQSNTNTPAAMNFGPISVGAVVANSKFVTIGASPAMAADYSVILPTVQGVANSYLKNDGAGALSWASNTGAGFVPLGAVIATMNNLPGAYVCTGTTAADSSGYVLCQGQTISDVTSPMNGAMIPNFNGGYFLRANTVAGGLGGAPNVTLSIANFQHTHKFPHTHQWGEITNAPPNTTLYSLNSPDVSRTSITNSDSAVILDIFNAGGSGSGTDWSFFTGTGNYYTSGVINPPNGAGGNDSGTTQVGNLSAAAFDILPPYIFAVFIMRVK